MSLIPINLGDLQEAKPVPLARYDLTITSCDETKTKEKQTPQFRISIAIDGHDDAPNVTHFVGIPSEKDEPKTAEFKGLLLKRFLTLFGIPLSNDTEQLANSMPGAKARGVEVGLSEPTESGDVYNRFVVPKLKGEAQGGAVKGAAPTPPKS